ncbi:MAG: hypothetical protein ACD_19C00426G0112 [uncultured bacterium]|nr:MAG: hypothetical protein ACD_19C00426G0112 [uncultured bacterium]
MLDLSDYKKIRTPFVFFDETGSINDKANRYFCLGMVKCMQPYFLDQKIRLIREKYHFYDEIKWNTISKFKLKIVKEIDEVLTILADFITTPANIRFEVDVKHNINAELKRLSIAGIHRVDSKGVNLIQITDLFIGAVAYNYKLHDKLVRGDKNKISIMNYLLKKLDINTFIGVKKLKRFNIFEYKNKGPSS